MVYPKIENVATNPHLFQPCMIFFLLWNTHKDILRNDNTFDNTVYFESNLDILLTISNFATTCLAVIKVL